MSELGDLTILAVEDNDFQRLAVVRLLEAAGVGRVLQAADGAEGLEVLRSFAVTPDIVLSDVDMPGMDGIEFLRHVAAGRLARAVAVNSSLDASMLAAIESMAKGYGLQVLGALEKPLTAERLSALLASYRIEATDAGAGHEQHDPACLRAAIASRELRPWFQPKVRLATGEACGVEALVRWVRADGTTVPPGAFLPDVEQHGLIDLLTESVLAQTCEQLAGWCAAGLTLTASVNLSMGGLDDVQVADRYCAVVADHGVQAAQLTFELTETAVASNLARSLDVLTRLRLRGFGLSIDDFGTGYSSLAQLRQMPFTELKVDQSFVRRAHQDPRRRAMVETSLDLARRLNLRTVAEGVEERAEWDLLAELGTDEVQGYFVARPMPGEDIPEWSASWSRG
ncbi:MAG TPA: EAL domain-containing response regulator [Mycobacteriales bacterium]|nr:EAL domain-containing response regulator [Mycobacteriales bacterium]